MYVAALILGIAALGGMAMVAIRLSGSPRPPTWLAIVHGLIAVIGLATLTYAAVEPGIPLMAQVALGVIVLAAMGGSAMFFLFHLKGLALPIPLMIGALVFGFAQAIPLRLDDFFLWSWLPEQFIRMIPYVVTIVAIAGFVGKVQPPAAAGRAYEGAGGT